MKNGITIQVQHFFHKLLYLFLSPNIGLAPKTIEHIVTTCVELTELNLEKTKLSKKAISILFENLPSKLQKLCLTSCHEVNDETLKILLDNCKNLIKLDLDETEITSASAPKIIEKLSHSLQKLSLPHSFIGRFSVEAGRCIGFNPTKADLR